MKRFNPDVDAPEYKGPYAPYDILKEGAIAFLVVALLTVVLAVLFGSPDSPAVSIKSWSNAAPVDFASTAFSELNGTSGTATYGAPFNTNATGQQLGPLQLAKWAGVRTPVNAAQDFVLSPLKSLPKEPALTASLAQWNGANSATRTAWMTAYNSGLAKMTYTNDQIVVPTATAAGPIPTMISDLTAMAQSGALDESLLTQSSFYTTDYTKPLLFIADGQYLGTLAQKDHLLGEQWGMMNETGSWPGQAWLWLYTFWYQVPPFNTSGNADVLVWGMMMLLTTILALIPFIPGLRSIPRRIPLYRIIWREHYQNS